MTKTVFFSWQADTATTGGRNFILRALDYAVARITEDTSVSEADRGLEVDRDTQGVAGTPPIVDTIFRKIDDAAVYVADLTFVASRLDGRPSPNPNVLIEYGWALKSLGHERIVLVMNVAFGEPSAQTLPFNLAHLRHPIKYCCQDNADESTRTQARIQLGKDLENALKPIVASWHAGGELPRVKPFTERSFGGPGGRFRALAQPLGVVDDRLSRSAKTVRLAAGYTSWLRVMPSTDPERTWKVSELREQLNPKAGGFVMPFGGRGNGFSMVRAEDGIGNFTASAALEDATLAVSFAFSTGEIWGVESEIVGLSAGPPAIIPDLFDMYSQALEAYAKLLTRLEVPFPYSWEAGIEGIRGRQIYVPWSRAFPFAGHCVSDVVVGRGVHHEGEDHLKSLRPFFEKLYEACGLSISDLGKAAFT